MNNKYFIGLLIFVLNILVSCASVPESTFASATDNIISNPETAVKNDINDYAYLQPNTAIYSAKKVEQQKLSQPQKAFQILKTNAAQGITYNASEEEKIEKLATQHIEAKKWKIALETLIKYEPILTHNKNLTHQLIFVALKLEYYDFAIDQLQLALQQKYDPKNEKTDYFEKQVILAHVYYLADKYKQAAGLYTQLYQTGQYSEAARYLFLIGYKEKDLAQMSTYLDILGKNHKNYVEYSFLLAQSERENGNASQALSRLEELYTDRAQYNEESDIILQYAHMLIQNKEYETALSILSSSKATQVSDFRQYHFMKSYIYFQQGKKSEFQKHLNLTSVEEKYKKDLMDLFLNQSRYLEVYAKIFQKEELEQYKITQLVRQNAEAYTYKYINKPRFKDAVLVREEFTPVTEPIRLPASLEFNRQK